MKDSDKYHLMIVGDVHGHYEPFLETIRLANHSLQLGDLGFDYGPLVRSKRWHPKRHKFLPGNHDNYTIRENHSVRPEDVNSYNKYLLQGGKVYEYTHLPENFVGHFGVWKIPDTEPGGDYGDSIFFVRGAWSIDFYRRTLGLDIWDNEELTHEECELAIQAYTEAKPQIVVTHTGPQLLESHLKLTFGDGRPVRTRTGMALDRMFELHKPKLWIFGHYHQEFDKVIDDCRFVCLEELAFMCFDDKMNPVTTNSERNYETRRNM